MKVELQLIGVNRGPEWRDLIVAQLSKLENLASIESAQVRLEVRRKSTPAAWVFTRLEVTGPDFHSEARDHTWKAALLKVVKDLERQIRCRRTRRADRWKTNLQLGRMPRGAVVSSGGRA